ncbi:hypothetical protein RJ641_005329 [Dillenia turbinata]|uniref:Uncharacterized protein n=1 Tax=Dillenia turbinata TaxID=194707 RepID=A0AAN8V944_9MAGN
MPYYFSTLGYFQLDWAETNKRVALVSLLTTLVESLPIDGVVDDNVSVPLTTIKSTSPNISAWDANAMQLAALLFEYSIRHSCICF